MRNIKPEPLVAETVESRWDIKKIIIGMIILLVIGSLGLLMFSPKSRNISNSQSALGVSVAENQTPTPALPSKEDVQNIVLNAQSALSQITSENITSSQAAIQKIIRDLQTLEEKKDAIGIVCDLVCKNR